MKNRWRTNRGKSKFEVSASGVDHDTRPIGCRAAWLLWTGSPPLPSCCHVHVRTFFFFWCLSCEGDMNNKRYTHTTFSLVWATREIEVFNRSIVQGDGNLCMTQRSSTNWFFLNDNKINVISGYATNRSLVDGRYKIELFTSGSYEPSPHMDMHIV